ncbi:MAG: YhfC family intramembrane metalloprotease [Oscillospiraceae bacterium]|nr:YhfC family intramembrane metalloprotease [Oscillospiraceae bacterium]
MDEVRFSAGTIAGFAVESILTILIPIILLIVWKKKTGASLKPAITGMIVFPLFGLVLKLIPGYFLLIADNPVSRAITSNIWLYSIIGGGLLAGIFEEGGRFVAFRTVLKNFGSGKDAISYGIGHGGFESAYVGFSMMSILMTAIMVNNGGMALLTAGMDAVTAETFTAQLKSYADSPFYVFAVLGTFERICAITVHISFSVLVFTAARDKKYIWLFPCAIILHTGLNSMTGFYSSGMVSAVAVELMIAAYSAIMAFLAFKIYKKVLKTDN